MMKKNITFLIILMITGTAVFAMDTGAAVKAAVSEFGKQVDSPAVIGIGNFVYADKNIGSSYSLYLQELASKELQASGKFILASREHMDTIMEEMRLGLTGLTDEATSPEPGMLRGLELLVAGRFFDEGEDVKLFLELIEIESGLVLKKTDYLISKTTIPATVSLLPKNYNDALYVLDELSELSSGGGEGLEIRAWCIRGEGGIYRDSENLVVRFYANRNCYIKVYHIDVDRNLSLIFPTPTTLITSSRPAGSTRSRISVILSASPSANPTARSS